MNYSESIIVANGSDLSVPISIELANYDSFKAEFYTSQNGKVLVITDKDSSYKAINTNIMFYIKDYSFDDGWLFCKYAITYKGQKSVSFNRIPIYLSSDYLQTTTLRKYELWINKDVDRSVECVRIIRNLIGCDLTTAKAILDSRPTIIKEYDNYFTAESELRTAMTISGLTYETHSKYFTIK